MKRTEGAFDLLVRSGRASGRPVALLLSGILLLMTMLVLPGASATVAGPQLRLDPAEGQTGTTVGWVASGFAGCKPTGDADEPGNKPDPADPSPGGPGSPGPEPRVAPGNHVVSNGAPLAVAVVAVADPERAVELLWDNEEPLATATVRDGVASSTFVVPESAVPGPHSVTARCVGESRQDETSFTVTEPPVEQVVVPDVVGERLGEAEKILAGEGLALGETSGEGDTVESQSPEAGDTVDPGTQVDVDLGVVAPVLVEVPNLVDRSVEGAEQVLNATLLKLGKVVGDRDGTVQKQRPRAGKFVLRGTAVRITMAAVPPKLVRVPDLVGESSSSADTVLVAVGLALGGSADGDREIASQDPVAGSLVPVGTTVRVTYASPSGPGARPLWAVLAAVLLGSAAAAAGLYRLKRRLDRRWVRLHDVRAVMGTAPAPVETTEKTEDASSPGHTVRIEPHRDSGTHVLEELNR